MKKSKSTKPSKKEIKTQKEQIDAAELIKEYDKSFDALETTHSEFEDREKVLFGKQTEETKYDVKIVDPTLQTAIIKQNNQLMSQLPTGRVTSISKANYGQAVLMDLVLHKYVIPNATSQYNVFTKIWLMSLYTKVYGSFAILVDYVDRNGYVGPDFFLIPARAVVLQIGKYTMEDSDYVYIRSVVSKDWLKKRDKKVWKNIDEILEAENTLDQSSGNYASYAEKTYSTTPTDLIELVTKYERGKWITFAPQSGFITRELEKKEKDLPVIMNYSYPMLDRVMGLGEIERGITIHQSQNELTNLYMSAVKMSVAPPVKIDLSGVVPKTIVNKPGAKWIIRNGAMNAVQEVQRSPLGLTTFQSTYGFLKSSILGLTNTTDTSISRSMDVGMGKTPQALKMQQAMEQTKTSFDMRMLEGTISKLYTKMINSMTTKQKKPMKFYLLEDEIKTLAETYPDVAKLVNESTGEMIIQPSKIKDAKYKFLIDPASTMKKDEVLQNENVKMLIETINKLPGASDQILKTGELMLGDKKLIFSELIQQLIKTSSLEGIDRLLVDNDKQEQQEEIVTEHQKDEALSNMQPMPPMPGMGMQPGMPGMPGMPAPAPVMPMQPMQPMQPASVMPAPINFENDPELAEIINQIGG